MCQNKVRAMQKKKEKKEKISMSKEHEKKSMPKSMNNPMLKSMKKKEKDSPYFQMATIKRERTMHKGV
jgi:hypothetical protein